MITFAKILQFPVSLSFLMIFGSATPELATSAEKIPWEELLEALTRSEDRSIPSQLVPYLERMPVRNRPATLRGDAVYEVFRSAESLLAHTQALSVDSNLKNWSSGGRLRQPRAFSNEEWTAWLVDTFRDLRKAFPEIRLNLLDLFHGHIVWNEKLQEVFVVLHSKEYPVDLDPFHVKRALLFEPSLDVFSSSDQSFRRRNLIWSLNHDVVWRLDTGVNSPFSHLVPGDEGSLEKKANTLPEQSLGESVADLNVFETGRELLLWVY